MTVLDQINGVYFTGGGLDLIDKKTGKPHQYYKTAKIIYQYAKDVKDKRKEEFPLLGICQGQQLFSILNNDDKDLLEKITYNSVVRKIHWEDRESKLFKTFNHDLKDYMENEPSVFHYHSYGVNMESYYKSPQFQSEFKII